MKRFLKCLILFCLVLGLIGGCMFWNKGKKITEPESDRPYKYTGILPLLGAVQNGDLDDVKRLAPLKEGMEDRNGKGGQTAFSFAMSSGQTEIAEILLDNGANPWSYNEFGFVIDADAENSPTTKKDLEAYWRVREKLLEMGYPLHSPAPQEILKMASEGKWPPAFVSEEFKRTSRP
ncbi:hypothetical protein FAI40_08490 [Acetobacteraceae bacterium]|nr:hypothetical protein FAI40_08490 [Acetobacteraceae bacterium]